MTDQNIERGAQEEASGVPLTPTEVKASREAPSQSPGRTDPTGGEEESRGRADKADAAGGTDV
jgi:hypothetical protein